MTRRVVCGVAAVAAVLASAGCGGTTTRRARADSSLGESRPVRPSVVMFLGDSYTTGRLGQIPELTYAGDTARTLGWQVVIGGYRGTGFVARGSVHKTFLDLFHEQLAWRPRPDLVIVSGGHNDRFHSPQAVAESATELLITIRRTWGGTRLLLIGPMWGDGEPTRAVEDVRDVLAGVAGQQHVPFVDPLTTILDPSLPLTVTEWDEWGNPLADKDVYSYMKSYSPYENVEAKRYPAILAMTSLNDTRVYYVEPAKWVAALRQYHSAESPWPTAGLPCGGRDAGAAPQ